MNIKIMMFDLNIKLYTPHRNYILTELFDNNNCKKRIICSKTPSLQLSDYLNSETLSFRPDLFLVDPWITFEDKRDTSFQSANLIQENEFDKKCEIIFKFLKNKEDTLKVILGGWMDIHSLSKKDAEQMKNLLLKKDFYFWGLGKKSFINFKQSDIEAKKTNRPHTTFFSDLILNTNLEKKIIPYIHSIPKNFYHLQPHCRKFDNYEFDFHVPGSLASYPDRIKAQEKHLKIIIKTISIY